MAEQPLADGEPEFEGARLSEWLDQAAEIFQQSAWGPALTVQGIGVLSVLRSYLAQALNELLRDQKTSAPKKKERWLELKINYLNQYISGLVATAQSARPAAAEVVFWPWQKSHLKQQVPVYRALAALGHRPVFVTSTLEAFQTLKAQKIDPVYAPGIWQKALKQAAQTGRDFSRLIREDPHVQLSGFGGLAPERCIQAYRKTLLRLLPMVFEMAASAEKILGGFAPGCLVVGNDLTLVGQVGCQMARSQAVPSACIMHGNITGDTLQKRHFADLFLVYGENHRQQLSSLGVPAGQIAICGAPYLDTLPRQTGAVHPQISQRLAVGGRRVVLAATSGPGHSISMAHHLRTIKEMMRASVQYPELVFIAKLHKKDRPEYYEQVKSEVPDSRLRVVRFEEPGFPADIFAWLQGTSILLTGASTTAVEAMLMGVPVISMDFQNELHGVDFIDAQATWHVQTGPGLNAAIAGLLEPGASRAQLLARADGFVERNFYKLDGNSAGRAAAKILELAKKI